jgi:hypothetical protein
LIFGWLIEMFVSCKTMLPAITRFLDHSWMVIHILWMRRLASCTFGWNGCKSLVKSVLNPGPSQFLLWTSWALHNFMFSSHVIVSEYAGLHTMLCNSFIILCSGLLIKLLLSLHLYWITHEANTLTPIHEQVNFI